MILFLSLAACSAGHLLHDLRNLIQRVGLCGVLGVAQVQQRLESLIQTCALRHVVVRDVELVKLAPGAVLLAELPVHHSERALEDCVLAKGE